MEEEERLSKLELEDEAADSRNGGTGANGSSNAPQHPSKRCRFGIAESATDSSTSKAKQASFSLHEARYKTKIKVN